VIASAVLAFVQGALVLIASVYVYFFASIITIATANAPVDLDAEGLATEGTVLAVVQLLSAILLITAGVLALNRRTRGTWLTLAAAHALQILLSIYWWARLVMLTGDIPDADIDGAFLGFPLFFAAGPAVGLGLVMAGAARRWFEDTPQR
jgi:magnesium-transporting ATPase (P-type)